MLLRHEFLSLSFIHFFHNPSEPRAHDHHFSFLLDFEYPKSLVRNSIRF